jgi:acetylornithine deacetylase/succinyl-diaminopimelate desuccinylase-like protein
MRTTCIATEISGGHAENALPQLARASVNCRLMPGTDPAAVEQTIRRVVADPQVSVVPARKPPQSPASPLRSDVFQAMDAAAQGVWPGVV